MHVMSYMFCFFFFFSSRRRHTRLVSDWSSDVCSSDLAPVPAAAAEQAPVPPDDDGDRERIVRMQEALREIGRASCRERVEMSVGAGSFKKKKEGVGERRGRREREWRERSS